jgi:hypothetical protein
MRLCFLNPCKFVASVLFLFHRFDMSFYWKWTVDIVFLCCALIFSVPKSLLLLLFLVGSIRCVYLCLCRERLRWHIIRQRLIKCYLIIFLHNSINLWLNIKEASECSIQRYIYTYDLNCFWKYKLLWSLFFCDYFVNCVFCNVLRLWVAW